MPFTHPSTIQNDSRQTVFLAIEDQSAKKTKLLNEDKDINTGEIGQSGERRVPA